MDTIFEIDSLEVFTDVSEIVIKSLYDTREITNHKIDSHSIQLAKEDVRKLVSSYNYNVSKIGEALSSKWSQEKVNCFTSLLEKHKTDLLYSALIYHNKSYGETITDVNWLLKLIFGTNDLKTLRYPLLQLILSTVNSNNEHKQRTYDINKDMLAKIISSLESVI